jgi:hypothetical protein
MRQLLITLRNMVGLVVAGFADVVADIAGVGEPRSACRLCVF